MRTKLFLLAGFLLIGLSSMDLPPHSIEWKAGEKLTWKDFQGKPNRATHFHALTDSGIGYSSKFENNVYSCEVRCYFDKKGSWYKKDKASDHLLQHEQLHFDLAELYTRKIRKAFATTTVSLRSNSNKLGKIYTKITKEHKKRQMKYDSETDHSKNKEAQARWVKTVAKEIAALDAWSEPEVTIEWTE